MLDFVNLTGRFNSFIVKIPKLVLCSFRDGVPFIKIKNLPVISISIRIVLAYSRPLLHLTAHAPLRDSVTSLRTDTIESK